MRGNPAGSSVARCAGIARFSKCVISCCESVRRGVGASSVGIVPLLFVTGLQKQHLHLNRRDGLVRIGDSELLLPMSSKFLFDHPITIRIYGVTSIGETIAANFW